MLNHEMHRDLKWPIVLSNHQVLALLKYMQSKILTTVVQLEKKVSENLDVTPTLHILLVDCCLYR